MGSDRPGSAASRALVLTVGLTLLGASGTATAWTNRPKTATVRPGQSIQAAVDAASPGDTIVVLPGDYTESSSKPIAVRISKPLSLIAKHGRGWRGSSDKRQHGGEHSNQVRLLAAPGQAHGIFVAPANPGDPVIDGLVIEGFTVENFQKFGIFVKNVKNFRIEGNESANNLENGIFPVLSTNGLVKRNVSYGSQDSALWVEASQNIRVVDNDLSGSPTGFEITISSDITAERNHIHHNTVGVGLYGPNTAGLPEDQWPSYWDDGRWHIHSNYVHDNNAENTAEGGMPSALPLGVGILALGVHDMDIRWNYVANNDFFGIGLVNYCLAVSPTPFNCHDDPPPADPKPADNLVARNMLVNNHTAPPPGLFASFASDLLEIVDFIDALVPGTSPTTNCFYKNKIWNTPPLAALTIPDPLPTCAMPN